MAKKTTAKKTNVNENDLRLKVTLAALDRAAKQIESKLEDKSVKLPEGGYDFEVNLHAHGSLSVGAPVEGVVKTVVDVSTDELIAAMFHSAGRVEITQLVKKAMKLIAASRLDVASKKAASVKSSIEVASKLISDVVQEQAKAFELTKESGGGTRAGSTTGKPRVRLEATVSGHAIDIDVDGDVAPE